MNTQNLLKKIRFDENYADTYTLIELTDYCNLKCPMCSHVLMDGPHSSPQGFMDVDLYFSILKHLEPKSNHHAIKLFWLGESFMHPEFYDILKGTYNHLVQKNFKYEYIDIHTNGHFLTDRNIELLVNTGDKLPRLTLSLDAVSPDVHKKIRRRGNVEKVNNSIKKLLKRRVESGKSVPSLIFQFIILPENAADAKPFVEHWTKYIDSIYESFNPVKKFIHKISNFENRYFKDVIWLKRVDCAPRLRKMAEEVYRDTIVNGNLYPVKSDNWEIVASIDNLWENQRLNSENRNEPIFFEEPFPDTTLDNDLPTGATMGAPREMIESAESFNKEDDENLLKEQKHRRPCAGPFKTPCIRWDGETAICCFDPAMQLGLGNLKTSNFEELWYGNRINEIRLAHIEGRFGDIITHDGFKKCLKCAGYDTPVISDEEVLIFLEWMGRKDLYDVYLKRIYPDSEN